MTMHAKHEVPASRPSVTDIPANGMTSAAGVGSVEKALRSVPGVLSADYPLWGVLMSPGFASSAMAFPVSACSGCAALRCGRTLLWQRRPRLLGG
ncbi:heavy metal-associated domain-containing protein [Bosea vestrisii]|uniref:heavy-metal-associated domain-containing protein n=1 Tax=Bosea vestrisii TaxID=151416 RepID=UPI0024E02E06|nr:heavy metal-associated domain-containing protein [Bosea vestrisii]WID94816.1 heavy metal-associated domain-containing protein [Bosea vestrisii]